MLPWHSVITAKSFVVCVCGLVKARKWIEKRKQTNGGNIAHWINVLLFHFRGKNTKFISEHKTTTLLLPFEKKKTENPFVTGLFRFWLAREHYGHFASKLVEKEQTEIIHRFGHDCENMSPQQNCPSAMIDVACDTESKWALNVTEAANQPICRLCVFTLCGVIHVVTASRTEYIAVVPTAVAFATHRTYVSLHGAAGAATFARAAYQLFVYCVCPSVFLCVCIQHRQARAHIAQRHIRQNNDNSNSLVVFGLRFETIIIIRRSRLMR